MTSVKMKRLNGLLGNKHIVNIIENIEVIRNEFAAWYFITQFHTAQMIREENEYFLLIV